LRHWIHATASSFILMGYGEKKIEYLITVRAVRKKINYGTNCN
jgi:hypothetical protein